MNKDILIEVPLVDQIRDTKDTGWEKSTCGICSVKMLMLFRKPELSNVPVMEMVAKGLETNSYLENIGWKHLGLVNIAKQYRVELDYQKEFYKGAEKETGLNFINKNLKEGKPVIASVYYGFNPEKGGHLVVVHGLREEGDTVIGYHIQDPNPEFGNNYFVSKEKFLAGWRGGMIYFSD